jgi:hypothetical protein
MDGKNSYDDDGSHTHHNSHDGNTEETFHLNGEELLKKVKELVKEANVRRIIVKDKKGGIVAEFPLAVGAVLTVLLPVFAAVGAIAALLSECSITVVRDKTK